MNVQGKCINVYIYIVNIVWEYYNNNNVAVQKQ